jgi:hypothetical protein
VQADGIAGRHNSTGDDVVAIHQGAGNGLANPITQDKRSQPKRSLPLDSILLGTVSPFV